MAIDILDVINALQKYSYQLAENSVNQGDPEGNGDLYNVVNLAKNQEILDPQGAALAVFKRGLMPIPMDAWSAEPAVPVDEWLNSLSRKRIKKHWRKHPDHGMGLLAD